MQAGAVQVPSGRRQFLLESCRHGTGLPDGQQRSCSAKRILYVWPDHRGNESQHPEAGSKPDYPVEHRVSGYCTGSGARRYGLRDASAVQNMLKQRNHSDSDNRHPFGELPTGK